MGILEKERTESLEDLNYWEEELDKCKNGTTLSDGTIISGLVYWMTTYLNPPIHSDKVKQFEQDKSIWIE